MGCNCSRSRRRTSTVESASGGDHDRGSELVLDSFPPKPQRSSGSEPNRIFMINALARVDGTLRRSMSSLRREEAAHFGPVGSFLSRLINNKRHCQTKASSKIEASDQLAFAAFLTQKRTSSAVSLDDDSSTLASSSTRSHLSGFESSNSQTSQSHNPKFLNTSGSLLQVPSFSPIRKRPDSKKSKRSRLKVDPVEAASPQRSIGDQGSLVGGSLVSLPATSALQQNTKRSSSSSSTSEPSTAATSPDPNSSDRLARQPAKKAATIMGEVRLFTSVRQLCQETIAGILLKNLESKRWSGSEPQAKVLCLFLFGCQGSNKGELAYDLVQHSPLHRVLSEPNISSSILEEHDSDCPLYHHLDVAAIIVANIDNRIREYHNLMARITRNKRDQQMEVSSSFDEQTRRDKLAMSKNSNSSSLSENENPNEDEDGPGNHLLVEGQEPGENVSMETGSIYSSLSRDVESREPSISSDVTVSKSNPTSGSDRRSQSCMEVDEFGQITLSTKQRSILQLKLFKYYNSITSKWVYSLIRMEVDKLEQSFRDKCSSLTDLGRPIKVPNRVYLINLVPNQLNLFKSCLYLKQNSMPQNELRDYCYWAIKFERRTNIKLLIKERAINMTSQSVKPKEFEMDKPARIVKNLQLRIANIRLPILGSISRSLESLNRGKQVVGSNSKELSSEDRFGSTASSVIEQNKDNEKLGPKFNESFAQKFHSINRLVVMRYNPTRDYKFANAREAEEAENEQEGWGGELEERSLSRSTSPVGGELERGRRMSCSEVMSRDLERKQQVAGEEWSPLERTFSMENMSELELEASKMKSPTLLVHSQASSRASSIMISSADEFVFSEQSPEHSQLEGQQQRGFRLCSNIGLNSNLAHPVKSAIELELFGGGERQGEEEAEQEEAEAQATSGALQISFTASGRQQVPSSNQNHFKLTPVKIAYANKQCQLMYEAKRRHNRTLKLKRPLDFHKLLRLVEKVNSQLTADSNSWLNEAVTAYNLERSRAASASSSTERGHRKRHSITNCGADLLEMPVLRKISLIVYTIRLDVSRLESSQFQVPTKIPLSQPTGIDSKSPTSERRTPESGTRTPLVPILVTGGFQSKRDERNALTRSITTTYIDGGRPLSSSAVLFASPQEQKRPGRHVQFRLSRAPGNGNRWDSMDENEKMKAQYREWIDDKLFISTTDSSLNMDAIVRVIKYQKSTLQ